MSLVKEDGAAIAIEGPVQKSSFKEKVMKMINAVITYIKNAFTAFISTVSKIYEKVRYNTFRDKVVQKLYGNMQYFDLETAKENGWKGIEADKYFFINPDINSEVILGRVKDILEEDNIFDELEQMKLDRREKQLKEKQEKIEETIERLNNVVYFLDVLGQIRSQTFNNKFHIDYDMAKMHYDKKAAAGFKTEAEYEEAKKRVMDAMKKHPLQFIFTLEGDKDGYVIPPSDEYNILKDFVLNYKKHLNKIDKAQKPIISDIHRSLANNTSEVMKITLTKDTSDNDFKQSELAILRTAIKVDDIHLKIYKTVTKNFLNACNMMFSLGIKTYSKIVMDVRKYLKLKEETK